VLLPPKKTIQHICDPPSLCIWLQTQILLIFVEMQDVDRGPIFPEMTLFVDILIDSHVDLHQFLFDSE